MRTTDKAVKNLLTRTAADMAANPEIRTAYAESKEAGDALVLAQTESAFLGRLAHEHDMLSTLAATSGKKGDGPAKLKRCPFCETGVGDLKVTVHDRGLNTPVDIYVECGCCETRGPRVESIEKEVEAKEYVRQEAVDQAVKLWNTR